MQSEIKIRNRIIGEGNPLFIVAECGVTCNYDVKSTKELIDVVQESGADAIKFIFWFPEEIMSDKTITYEYDTVNGRKSENMDKDWKTSGKWSDGNNYRKSHQN